MGGNIEGLGLKVGIARRARHGWWLLVLLPLGLVFAVCYRPVMRLKSEPPVGFMETRKEWDATRRAVEGRAARAYWQLAINTVQWKFAFGTELPAYPIDEFKLDEKDFSRSGIEAASTTRARYWNKLRETWPRPETWNRTYVWRTGWLTEFLASSMETVSRFVDGIMRRFDH